MIVLDTHVLVWWVSNAGSLSARARTAIRGALRRGPLVASTISILEIATAVRRGRLQLSGLLGPWLDDLRGLPELRFEPVTAAIAEQAGSFDDATPGDPADRIIAATAAALEMRLVTADRKLARSPAVRAVW